MTTTFTKPIHRIITAHDLELWKESPTHNALVSFVEALAASVRGKKITDKVNISASVKSILASLDGVISLVHRHPVVKDKEISRFGKPEFRDFYDDLNEGKVGILSNITGLKIGDNDNSVANGPMLEVATYFQESWGNRTRIDYGSGHELNFICFLLCLKVLNIIDTGDYEAVVLRVFNKYLSIMRMLQTEYWLEPAGSHGVWGLDDYHFLPFLFGASQLSNHEYLKPKSIHNLEVVEELAKDYFYFECINFINNVKTESLRWHSPMLDDISGVRSWKKVEEGMFKMFQGEVLNKLPIMQHFLFGSLIPCPDGVTPAKLDDQGSTEDDDPEHELIHNHFGDCCGIKVPAAFGAHNKKVLPFD